MVDENAFNLGKIQVTRYLSSVCMNVIGGLASIEVNLVLDSKFTLIILISILQSMHKDK